MPVSLQACVLGCLVRRRLVHGVREEYLKLVQEVEGGGWDLVYWPRENTLCLPVFRDKEGVEKRCEGQKVGEEEALSARTARHSSPVELSQSLPTAVTPDSSITTVHLSEDISLVNSKEGTSETTEPPKEVALEPSQLEAPHQTETGASALPEAGLLHESLAIPEGYHCLLESLSVPVPRQLPRDREGLLRLRRQLSMELLWLRQAIASRQNVSQHFRVSLHAQRTIFVLLL